VLLLVVAAVACGSEGSASRPGGPPSTPNAAAPAPSAASTTVALPTATPPRPAVAPHQPAILILTKTAGFRHTSIEPAAAALVAGLGAAGIDVVVDPDAAEVTEQGLARFDGVVMLSTTGDWLDDGQQAALEKWARAGGGIAGIHAATDAEPAWPFLEELFDPRARLRRHVDGFRETTVSNRDDDSVAHLVFGHTRAYGHDVAGRFAPRCKRQRRLELIFALDHQNVGEVHRARLEPHLHLTGAGRRQIDVFENDGADVFSNAVTANAADPCHPPGR